MFLHSSSLLEKRGAGKLINVAIATTPTAHTSWMEIAILAEPDRTLQPKIRLRARNVIHPPLPWQLMKRLSNRVLGDGGNRQDVCHK